MGEAEKLSNQLIWKAMPIGTVAVKEFEAIPRQSIYTTSAPRSGATWTNRLLSDLFNAGMQTLPGNTVQFWGDGWDSRYVIRKTHSLATLPGLVIYIQRDPRDVVASRMNYRCLDSIEQVLGGMDRKDDFNSFTEYGLFVEAWLGRLHQDNVMMIKYEDLHYKPRETLAQVVSWIGNDVNAKNKISMVMQRQCFDVALARLGDPHSMWRGIVGNWENFFTRDIGKRFDEYLGDLMLQLNYIESRDWWKSLPKESDGNDRKS